MGFDETTFLVKAYSHCHPHTLPDTLHKQRIHDAGTPEPERDEPPRR